MEIRRAKTEDLTEIMEIYAQARDFPSLPLLA